MIFTVSKPTRDQAACGTTSCYADFMKRKFLVLVTIIGLACLCFTGCSNPYNSDSSEPTYTVWTDVSTYTEFQ